MARGFVHGTDRLPEDLERRRKVRAVYVFPSYPKGRGRLADIVDIDGQFVAARFDEGLPGDGDLGIPRSYAGHWYTFDASAFRVLGREREVMTVPVLSTAHLPEDLREAMAAAPNRFSPCAAWEHGWFIWLGDEEPGMHPALWNVSRWLTRHGYADRWVRFDSDGSTADDLPVYED